MTQTKDLLSMMALHRELGSSRALIRCAKLEKMSLLNHRSMALVTIPLTNWAPTSTGTVVSTSTILPRQPWLALWVDQVWHLAR